jgi:hypothetical protein
MPGNNAERSDEEEQRPVRETIVRPELIGLKPVARERVLKQVAVKGGYCASCSGTDFEVGDALYLGFLFLAEDQDAYMVALTCRNPDCPHSRTGIILPEKAFLNDGSLGGAQGRAATWSAETPGSA